MVVNISIKQLRVLAVPVLLGLMIPGNIFTYATTDMEYVDNIGTTLTVDELDIESIITDAEEKVETQEIYTTDSADLRLELVKVIMSDNSDLIDATDKIEQANAKASAEAKARATKSAVITTVDQTDALLVTETPDENYTGSIVTLDPADRDLLERLVQGEAGGEGYEGAALVAQAIRDTIVYKGFTSVADVRTGCGYSGSISKEPNDNVKRAVAYIFDEGGIAVKHRIYYFYSPKNCSSGWHESQQFIIEHGGHRFFCSWK